MDSQRSLSPGSYTWRINRFSLMNQNKYYSDVFVIGGCKWRILIFPKGNNNSDYFSIYLDVPDSATLPAGWLRDASMTFTIVNQNDRSRSTKKETRHKFSSREADWGFASYKPLSELQDRSKGFLVNDTIIIEAEVEVHSAVHNTAPPPPATDARSTTGPDRFDAFFGELEALIVTAENSSNNREVQGSSSKDGNDRVLDLISGSPSLEEVEEAKESLKECLSDLFKLNMKDRLASALLTLTRAEVGISPAQKESIKAFRANFDVFIGDFLSFEQDNAEFELQKLARDQMFSSIKKNRDTHVSNKRLMESLEKEEEEIKRRLEEVRVRKEKLMGDWERLMAEAEETKAEFMAQEKKLAEADEKKRIAEERMSRSTTAWSSLKAQFL